MFFFLCLNGSQAYREEVESIRQAMAERIRVSETHDSKGRITNDYLLVEQLKETATEKELLRLCSDKSPVVRCYAFWALSKKGSKQIKSVLQKHLKDSLTLVHHDGCEGGVIRVNEFMLQRINPKRWTSPKESKLTNKEIIYFEKKIRLYNQKQ